MPPRVLVIGDSTNGKGKIASHVDIELADLGGVYRFAQLWGDDAAPTFPHNGERPNLDTYFPTAGGYRFVYMIVLPERQQRRADFDSASGLPPEIRNQLAKSGAPEIAAGEAPGMHRTDTVDLGVLVSGSLVMELDTGESIELQPGDTFVQNGANHHWHNRGEVPAVAVVTLIGGHPRA